MMPDMMNLHQAQRAVLMRPAKESPRSSQVEFPEYLKHADVLGDTNSKLKLTASNSLFHAVLKGRIRGTRYLLERTATVNGRNDYGYSVLTAALHVDDDKRREKLFRLLLDRGADPLFRDTTHNRNVLHWACLLGRTEQVKAVLVDVAGNIDLNQKDEGGHTPLHHAVMAGHLPIVTLLVDAHRKYGVTVDAPDNLGLTPYLHAKRLGYRDVAEYLHTEGLASQGHGDRLFRTPREWSQIGKFERQKAIEIHTQEAINIAKIRGKITKARHLEDTLSSPRMAIPNIVLPSYSPAKDHGVTLAARGPRRLCMSLPSLNEPLPSGDPPRPSSVNGGAAADPADGPPKPATEAFVSGTGAQQSTEVQRPVPGASGDPAGTAGVGAGMGQADTNRRASNSQPALTLMEMNEKGRHARTYRQSQFDESKASEYKHMLGNLTSIMDLLSQQQSKSFRQSVKYPRPETPKRRKSKNKVSSLAVIFGHSKSGRRSGRKRSPKPSAKKASAKKAARKEKAGGGEEKVKVKATEKKVPSVPLLKVNGEVV